MSDSEDVEEPGYEPDDKYNHRGHLWYTESAMLLTMEVQDKVDFSISTHQPPGHLL